MAIVMMRHLISRGLAKHRQGHPLPRVARRLTPCAREQVDLRGIVATLAPAYERARLIRGTLDMLGMHDVPVGVGSDGEIAPPAPKQQRVAAPPRRRVVDGVGVVSVG